MKKIIFCLIVCLLLLLCAGICGFWLRAGKPGSVDFHTYCAGGAALFMIAALIFAIAG